MCEFDQFANAVLPSHFSDGLSLSSFRFPTRPNKIISKTVRQPKPYCLAPDSSFFIATSHSTNPYELASIEFMDVYPLADMTLREESDSPSQSDEAFFHSGY